MSQSAYLTKSALEMNSAQILVTFEVKSLTRHACLPAAVLMDIKYQSIRSNLFIDFCLEVKS